jgi:hypothetical protein
MPIKKVGKKGTQKVVANRKPDFKRAVAGDTAATAAEPKEKLAPKLRRKADIVKALSVIGAHVLHTPEGLFRIVSGDKVHPASKRRIAAMMDSGALKRDSQNSNRYLQTPKSESI